VATLALWRRRARVKRVIMTRCRWAAVAVGLVLVSAACRMDDEAAETRLEADRGPSVVALLLDNTLLRARLANGEIAAKVNLGRAAEDVYPGRHLALGDEGRLFVLVRRDAAGPDEVAVVDASTLAVRNRYSLEGGVTYRGVVLARSGVLYAYGNRPRELLDEASGARARDAVVTAVDAANGSVLWTTTVRRAAGHDWWVYSGALSTDESALVLSYHGDDTTGADLVAVSADRVEPCTARLRSAGCLTDVHGAVVARGNGFIAATGYAKLLELDADGAVIGSLSPRFTGHLMQISLEGRYLYALGSCYQAGAGLSVVDVNTEAVRLWPSVCGERLALGPERQLAIAANVPVPLGAPSRVDVVDAATGRELRSVPTDVEVLDLSFVAEAP
jgi:hypothetical protein